MDTIHCISNETWERYAGNTLGEAELLALQNHADTCELCADVKEGIDLMHRPESLANTVKKLNDRAVTYLAAQPKETKKRLAPMWYWSAAAMVLIVVGAGWWMVNSQPTDLTDNTPLKPIEQSKVEVEKEKKDQSVISKSEPIKTENPTPEKRNKNGGTEMTKPATTPEFENDETLRDDFVTEKEQKVAFGEENDALEKKIAPSTTDKQATGVFSNQNADLKVTESLPSSVFLNNAITNNNSYTWDFGDAANSADSSVYYSAVQLYTQKHYDSCVNSLASLTTNIQSTYYEDALFLKAKVLIDQKNPTEAKKLLQQIIALKKKRRKEAQSLFNTLK